MKKLLLVASLALVATSAVAANEPVRSGSDSGSIVVTSGTDSGSQPVTSTGTGKAGIVAGQ